jgi:hypothetical protein
MQLMQLGIARGLLCGLLAAGVVVPTTGWSQTPLQHVEQQLRTKQQAANVHLQQMERITDPTQLAVETRRHLRMTEDILALLLERQTLLAEHTSRSRVSSGMPSAPPTKVAWDELKKGTPGGFLRRPGKDPKQAGR